MGSSPTTVPGVLRASGLALLTPAHAPALCLGCRQGLANPSMFRAGVLKCLPRTFEARLQLVPSLVPGALPRLLLPLSPASPPRRSPPRLPQGQLCRTSWSSVSVLLLPAASGPFCELPGGVPLALSHLVGSSWSDSLLPGGIPSLCSHGLLSPHRSLYLQLVTRAWRELSEADLSEEPGLDPRLCSCDPSASGSEHFDGRSHWVIFFWLDVFTIYTRIMF